MASGDIILSDGTTLTPEDFRRIAVEVLKLIETNAKDPGQWEAVSSLQGVTSLPVFQVIGSTYKLVRVAVEILRGVDGREVEFQVNKEGTHIQWRYTDDMWNNLIAIESLKGNPGDTPEFRKGPSGVEWKYVSEEDTAWRTLFAFEDLRWKFEDLTEEQIALFWQNLPDDVLALFQQPATEAAAVAIEAAKKAESAAATATQTNETMVAAELKRQQAEESRVETETSRVQAESERVTAEQSRAEAEQSRNTAEQSRISAETERNESETARKESETGRISAEEGRKTAETARAEAEQLRATAEEARDTAEQARTSAESERQTAEDTRKDAETERISAEEGRKMAETARTEAEQQRTTAEETRDSAEQARITAESERQTAETARAAAEMERASSEESRKAAETAREEASRIAVENANEATDRANTASALSEELNAHPMKPQGGYWFRWNTETDAYENTGIQAKGDVGSSFRIVGRYDTLDELKQAVPDGTDVDGVYAIGTAEPYSYYAWVVVDGVWQWDNQGQLRGAEGKSSFEVWSELPENEGKTLDDYFDWLSPQIQNGNWFIQGTDTGIRAQAVDARVEEAEGNTPTDYRLVITTANGSFTTPNLMGRSGSSVIDIDHEPTEADTHYTYNDVEYAFSVGDEVRWYDQDNEEYVLFKLYAVTVDGAVWEEIGSGGVALPTDIILSSPSVMSSDEENSYIYLVDGYLKGKEE